MNEARPLRVNQRTCSHYIQKLRVNLSTIAVSLSALGLQFARKHTLQGFDLYKTRISGKLNIDPVCLSSSSSSRSQKDFQIDSDGPWHCSMLSNAKLDD